VYKKYFYKKTIAPLQWFFVLDKRGRK